MIPFLLLCALGTFEALFFGTFFCWLFAFGIMICKGAACSLHPEPTITDLPSNDGDGGRLRDDQAAVNIVAPDTRDRTAEVPLTVPATAHVPSLEEIRSR